MKIGILSDTHSVVDARYSHHFAECDEIWHAGDIGCMDVIRHLDDGTRPRIVRAVRGNIDYGLVARAFRESEFFEVEGLKVYMTHIGGYPGRYAPGIEMTLAKLRPDIFVCGHSHILKVMPDKRFNLLHINPGAAGYHGWQKVRTLVRLEVDQGAILGLEVIELNPPKGEGAMGSLNS